MTVFKHSETPLNQNLYKVYTKRTFNTFLFVPTLVSQSYRVNHIPANKVDDSTGRKVLSVFLFLKNKNGKQL